MNKTLLFICFFFFTISFFSQITIKGKITDENNLGIPYTNVLVKKDSSSIILAYTYSNENGEYVLKIRETGAFFMSFSSLGYKTETFKAEIITRKTELIKNVILKEESFSLDEVIIVAERSIKIKKDTVTFNAKYFMDGSEEVIEDLLKKIPGLNIDSQGTIKVGNQEIEKLMIDGDDFFEKGYKILSKNMPPSEIEKIEVLHRYSNNKLLKGIEHSDRVAINLVLKDNAKRQWFGNTEIGYGNDNFYALKANLMNFGKKNKYYFLTNLNNIGYDATGDIQHLIKPLRDNDSENFGDNQRTYSFINLSASIPNFKASRTNFNNAELLSLNAIFKFSEKVKVKTLGFFNWDENDYFKNSVETNTVGEGFTNNEAYKLRKQKIIGFGKIDITYDISKTKMLEIVSKYNNSSENNRSSLDFNGTGTNEGLHTNNDFFDQKITYTNKFKENKVLLLTGRYIEEETLQNYTINQFLYQDLFPSITSDNVAQYSENKMQFAGFEAYFLDRKEKESLLELKFGNQFRKDKLISNFDLKNNDTIVDTPIGYQNNVIYITNDLYFNSKYRLKFNDFSITGYLGLHQLFNDLKQEFHKKETPFFINPSIDTEWKINSKNKIIATYQYNVTNAKVLDVYDQFILRDFHSFTKGTGTFNQLDASSFFFNYQLGNWNDRFFANTFVFYTKNHNFYSTNSIINQNYSLLEKIVVRDREVLGITSSIERYIKVMTSNFKLNFGFLKSNYKNKINNGNLREVKSKNYTYGFELRSGFSSFFNYHFGVKWTENEIQTTIKNSYTNNISFLDLSFFINDKFNVQLQSERYYFGNIEAGNNEYYFLDTEIRYILKKNKITFSISGKNLLNTETFKTYSISDISTSETTYRLLPRYVILKVGYRF